MAGLEALFTTPAPQSQQGQPFAQPVVPSMPGQPAPQGQPQQQFTQQPPPQPVAPDPFAPQLQSVVQQPQQVLDQSQLPAPVSQPAPQGQPQQQFTQQPPPQPVAMPQLSPLASQVQPAVQGLFPQQQNQQGPMGSGFQMGNMLKKHGIGDVIKRDLDVFKGNPDRVSRLSVLYADYFEVHLHWNQAAKSRVVCMCGGDGSAACCKHLPPAVPYYLWLVCDTIIDPSNGNFIHQQGVQYQIYVLQLAFRDAKAFSNTVIDYSMGGASLRPNDAFCETSRGQYANKSFSVSGSPRFVDWLQQNAPADYAALMARAEIAIQKILPTVGRVFQNEEQFMQSLQPRGSQQGQGFNFGQSMGYQPQQGQQPNFGGAQQQPQGFGNPFFGN